MEIIKSKKEPFTLESYRDQLKHCDEGGFRLAIQLLSLDFSESIIKSIEEGCRRSLGIFESMTATERKDPSILSPSRLKRIANGSGTKVADITKLLKTYETMKKCTLKIKPKPNGNEPPPVKTASMPIPEKPVFTKAIGRKYGTA
jgi:signal recognition particle subunit SRP54